MEVNKSPLPIPFDESRWGQLLAWESVAPGVYEICTRIIEGYLIDKDDSKGIISEQAYQYGQNSDDNKYIFFNDDHGMYVIKYEITLYKLQQCNDQDRDDLQAELTSSALYGTEEYSSYFGAWTPQPTTPWGLRHRYITVDNGIWFVQTNGKWVLSLCHVLSEGLNDFQRNLAVGNPGDDMYWMLEDCAPVIHQLVDEGIPSMAKFITSTENLHFCLCECFPAYTKTYNCNIKETIQIQRAVEPKADVSYLESKLIVRAEGASINFLRRPYEVMEGPGCS